MIFFFFAVAPAMAEEAVSRQDFIDNASRSFFGKGLSELDVMQGHFFDALPDGKIHLDWPITRNAAARAILTLLKPVRNFHSCPGFFSDVPVQAPLYQILTRVGGAFPAFENNRFAPDMPVSAGEMKQVLDKLNRRLPEKPDLATTADGAEPSPGTREQPAPEGTEGIRSLPGQHFDTVSRWEASDSPMAADARRAGSDTGRVDRLLQFVPNDQVSPDRSFDVKAADEGLTEVEMLLDSLEKTVRELIDMRPVESQDLRQLREALKNIRDIVEPLIEKLQVSATQLAAALLIDSESVRMAAGLKRRLVVDRGRLQKLKETLDTGIRQLPKPKEGETQ